MQATDFRALTERLPQLLAPLHPLVQQWDRLSRECCWMLILADATKVDLIFPDEPHRLEPPWEPTANNLDAIDAHFWDWTLWLKPKEMAGKRDLVASELEKLFDHLLMPLGATARPSSIGEAVACYRMLRDHAERTFGTRVRRDVDAAVSRVVEGPS